MMINTRLKLLLFISLFLTTTILLTFAGLRHIQQENLQQLSHIMQLESSIDVLRSRLWALQEFQDEEVLTQTLNAHQQLKAKLAEAQFLAPATKVLTTNLNRQADSLAALLKLTQQHMSSPPQRGITSARGMLTTRFNITIQSMSEDLTSLQRLVIDSLAEQQSQILSSTILFLLAGSVISLLVTMSTLKAFRESLHRMKMGISKLSQGDLDSHIEIVHQNELAILAQKFNAMTHKLKETTIRKEALQGEVAAQTKQLKRQTQKLKYVAEHDDLTGLYSRSAFERQIDTAIARCQRTQMHAAMLFIDLDKFKQVNDSLGHDNGDKVLSTAARRIQSAVRSSDICGRLGGDEFVVWLEPINDIEEVTIVIDKIIRQISPPIVCGRTTVSLTVSIGVAMYPRDELSRLSLIKVADDNMYQAKQVKGNSHRFTEQVARQVDKHQVDESQVDETQVG
ncbi:diguanylate cyclase [Shewanella rhizosphaerae]|uniref:GGDEF domain-containing protein n=1 Tax=Shewanella rhizosphaerae TaxID=2864207 RepID=UPI001C6593EE|nr:GGDEF domain-containing protein [Shewanella rhizosphaerae]QYK11327.1 diguanylate cyclase [Shewanella rhizosphaerae]